MPRLSSRCKTWSLRATCIAPERYAGRGRSRLVDAPSPPARPRSSTLVAIRSRVGHAGDMAERRSSGAEATASQLPKRFARNTASNYALTAVLVGVALVTTPILTHHLGTQGFGIWIFVGSAMSYVQLLDLGFGGAVVATIARLSGVGDDDALERALNTAFFLLLALGVAAMAICGLAAAFLPAALHLKPSLAGIARDLFLLLGFDVAVSIPMDTFGCGLVALQRYDLLNTSLIGVAVGQAVAWTLVLVTGGGLLLLGIVTVSISLLGQVGRYILLRRLLPTVSITLSRFERGQVRAMASSASWYALGDLIDSFLDQASILVLGFAKGVTSAGLFAVSDKLATFGTRMGTPLTQPLFPHAATLIGRGEDSRLAETTRTGTRVSAGVTVPICLIVALFARPALIAWVGPSYELVVPAVTILAVAYGLRSFVTAPIILLSGAGGQRLVAMLGLVKITLQVALTAILGVTFGVTGAAVGILITAIVVDAAMMMPVITRRLGTRAAPAVLSVLRTHVVAFVAAGAVGWYLGQGPVVSFVRSHARLASIAVVAAAALAVLLLYVAVFLLTGVDPQARRRAIAELRHSRRTALLALFRSGSLRSDELEGSGHLEHPAAPADGQPDSPRRGASRLERALDTSTQGDDRANRSGGGSSDRRPPSP